MKQRALVSGGNKGIGLEVTKSLIALGHDVIVVARDFSHFALAEHKQVTTVVYDLSNISGLAALVASLEPIDILINNAGVMFSLPFNAYGENKKDAILKLNLESPVKLIELISEGMIQRGGGRIVNNASIAGQIGHPDIWYGMTKAALINATKSFAKIFGEHIVINAVAPSPVDTDMQKVNSKERKEAFLKTVISKRFATAKEVADTIVWLATDAPEYINGSCIDINNGSFPR